MSRRWKMILFAGLMLCIYSMLFYLQITMHLRMDFSSFYAAALAYSKNLNPFQDLISSFLLIPNKLPANLNPPFFLELMRPISHLPFISALSLWFIVSLILNIGGCILSFFIIAPKDDFKRNWFLFLLIYFAMFSTLMNANIGQLGSLLLFCVIAGYFFFLKHNDYMAGILWGFIIAIKLFPGLIFLFVLTQKRYKVLGIMLLSCLFMSLLPLWNKGTAIYTLYMGLLPRVMWYGSSWNGSLYGFLFRILVSQETAYQMLILRLVYYSLFVVLVCWYIKTLYLLKQKEATHFAFSYTLVMMLLLSPLGWMYYFSLLIMPLALIWQNLSKHSPSMLNSILWALCLFLINFPNGNMQKVYLAPSFLKISIYSAYFYGLVLVLYLLLTLFNTRKPSCAVEEQIVQGKGLLLPVQMSLSLGLFIVLTNLIYHWYYPL